MIKHKTLIRVRYAETDQMQFVHHSRYFEYFEIGRTELLRHFGLPYREVEENGFQLPLIEAGIEFKLPAVYDDLLEVEAKVSELYTPKVHIDYTIKRQEIDQLLVIGFTDHVFIKSDTKRAVRPPKFYLDKLAPHFRK